MNMTTAYNCENVRLWVESEHHVTKLRHSSTQTSSGYSEPYVGHRRLHFKLPNLHGWPNYGNHVSLWNTNRVVTRRANVLYRMQRQKVESESEYYKTLSMNRDLKYSNGPVATRKFLCFVRTCEKNGGSSDKT